MGSAYWAMQLLTKLIPENMLARMTFLHGLGFTTRVWAFAGAVSLLVAVLFSLTPTLHFSLSEIRDSLAEGGRGHAGNTWRRLGSKLVVLELATAVVLLVGAGLLGKSLYLLLHVDLGLRPDHLATLNVAAPKSDYGKDPQAIALARQVLAQAAACRASNPSLSPPIFPSATGVTRPGSACWAVLGTASTTMFLNET